MNVFLVVPKGRSSSLCDSEYFFLKCSIEIRVYIYMLWGSRRSRL